MKRTLIEETRKCRLLNETELTQKEYLCELKNLNNKIASIVLGTGEGEYVGANEVVAYLESEARNKGIANALVTKKALASLSTLSKELCVSLAGSNAEYRVNKMLQYTERADASNYTNVYLTDGEEETEIDNIIVTNNGVILAEIKGAKKNVTITPEGRLVYGEDESYGNDPLAVKMERKRRLLRKVLEEKLRKRGITMPLVIESYVVFSIPKDVRININDLYKKEKICTGNKLKYIVKEFSSEQCYTDEHLEVINEIISEMATEQKKFNVDYDFNKIFEDIIQLVYTLENVDREEYARVQADHKARIWMKISRAAAVIAERSAGRAGTTVEICRKGAA